MNNVCKKKYTPGQRLNSAAEVMQALLDGEKITLDFWRKECFVQLKNEKLVDEEGKPYGLEWYEACSFHIYTPPPPPVAPKRKVKREVTVWVNVYEDCTTAYDSKTEAEFRAMGCKALAVAIPHKFTLEVELDAQEVEG